MELSGARTPDGAGENFAATAKGVSIRTETKVQLWDCCRVV